jgi:hypothetical protein
MRTSRRHERSVLTKEAAKESKKAENEAKAKNEAKKAAKEAKIVASAALEAEEATAGKKKRGRKLVICFFKCISLRDVLLGTFILVVLSVPG